MCTLTWWRDSGGSYEVFFNRDEKRTRSRAEPPRRHVKEGVEFLAPLDPDGGGTWILASHRGLVVCLLNRWHEQEGGGGARTSRGRLVMEAGGCADVAAVEGYLRAEDLNSVRPFTMVALDRFGERAWSWNGESLAPEPIALPMCSSSFQFQEVATARRKRLEELRRPNSEWAGVLESFHGDADGGASAYTVRMCRADAQTMSRSRVTVTPECVKWVYLEERPDFAGEPREFVAELGRVGAKSSKSG